MTTKNKNSESSEKVIQKTDEIQKMLQSQIEKNLRIMELIANRNKFLETKGKLNELTEGIKDTSGDLDNESLSLVLQNSSDYRNKAALSITNNFIIKEFIDFIKIKINSKVVELEKQIII